MTAIKKSLPRRRFDAVIVGAGGSGMRASLQLAEAGLNGFELESWVALYVASGTPKEVVQKLSNDVKRAMEQADTKQRADAAGVEVRYLTPDATTKLLERDTASWAKAIKAANIKFD